MTQVVFLAMKFIQSKTRHNVYESPTDCSSGLAIAAGRDTVSMNNENGMTQNTSWNNSKTIPH